MWSYRSVKQLGRRKVRKANRTIRVPINDSEKLLFGFQKRNKGHRHSSIVLLSEKIENKMKEKERERTTDLTLAPLIADKYITKHGNLFNSMYA